MTLSSFRSRLLCAILACAVVAVASGGWMAYSVTRHSLYDELDHFLEDKLRFYRASCVQRGKRISFAMSKSAFERLDDPNDPEYFQYRFQDGRTIFKSYSLPEADLPLVGQGSEFPEARDITLPSGAPGRCLGLTFTPSERGPDDVPVKVHLVVAHEREKLAAALDQLVGLIFWAGGGAILLLSLVTILVVRYLVRPLVTLAGQIESVPLEATGQRFHLSNSPSELRPVITRLNELKGRVELAIAHEREFTANAAHELRNPLAGLRSQLELALSVPRDPDSDAETLREALEIQQQMEASIENLLVMARLDAGTGCIEEDPVELPLLLRRCWKPYFDRAAARSLKVRWNVDASLPPITSSPSLLRILSSNLMDNAVSYTPKGGEIQIAANVLEHRVTLSFANTNPGISTGQLSSLLRRFQRGAGNGAQDRLQAGIGLNLCHRIARTLGGNLEPAIHDSRFQIDVFLPFDGLQTLQPGS